MMFIKIFVELRLLSYVIDLCCSNINGFSTIRSKFSVYLFAVLKHMY